MKSLWIDGENFDVSPEGNSFISHRKRISGADTGFPKKGEGGVWVTVSY